LPNWCGRWGCRSSEGTQWAKEHDAGLLSLRTDISFDSLRSDPRYAELVRKIGFPQE
jgi:hypothetical protein